MRSERERREHLVAYAVVAALKLLLAVALAISGVQSYQVLRRPLPGLPAPVGWVLPLLLLAGAAVALASGYRTLRQTLSLRRAPTEPPPDA